MLYLDTENRIRLGRERAAQLATDYRQAQRGPHRTSQLSLLRPHLARLACLPSSWLTVARRLGLGGTSTIVVVIAALVLASSAAASGTVGTALPPGFPIIRDASLHTPLLGFGAAGRVKRTPVVFVHGNDDTPYPTPCNPFGRMHSMAQYFADHGYSPSELWGVGYQGDQCDLLDHPELSAAWSHTTMANIPDLTRFVAAVLAYTHAKRVDLVGHSLGGTLARAVTRFTIGTHAVRRLVMIDAPNQGVIFCSPDPLNYAQTPEGGGFTPDSPFCLEYGSDQTPFLQLLNGGDPTPGPTRYLVIRNADRSFVFFPTADGPNFPAFPAEDRYGQPHDFSQSASIAGAAQIDLTDQGRYDDVLGSAHMGILNSPETWNATYEFLKGP
jgi:pimeloyl-ACP methyl ester carboxylesterase